MNPVFNLGAKVVITGNATDASSANSILHHYRTGDVCRVTGYFHNSGSPYYELHNPRTDISQSVSAENIELLQYNTNAQAVSKLSKTY